MVLPSFLNGKMRMLRWTCLLPSYPRLVLRCRCRLVRSVVPEAREDELIRYRTINNQGVETSRNLRDTIVTSRVSWLRTQGDRHFRVFRVPASVFQVPVGGDGRPLADVLRGERAPMDALHRRPEAACPNVWQRIGVSEHDGRQAGAGPRSRNRPPRVGVGPTIHGNGRPPVVPDGPPRRYGGGVLPECGVSERRGEGVGGVVSWLPSAAKESRLRTA